MLTETGVRVGELLGLTSEHVQLGDDAHVRVVERVYRGERKKLKTETSVGKIPLSPGMASWLAALRPIGAPPTAHVFASKAGTALNSSNVHNRVLGPALASTRKRETLRAIARAIRRRTPER